MTWWQGTVELPAMERGVHLITDRVADAVPELASCEVGLLHVFVQHTSASLAINEAADPDVRADVRRWLDRVVPEDAPYWRHTLEGPDDMPAHVKSILTGASVMVPIREGRLALGRWQGIYFCEHRDRGRRRRLLLTRQGGNGG